MSLSLTLHIEPLLDNFQQIDYQSVGRIQYDYQEWEKGRESLSFFVKGQVKPAGFWGSLAKPTVSVMIEENVEIPSGFDIELFQDNDRNLYAPGYKMQVQLDDNKQFYFGVRFLQREIDAIIKEPVLISFSLAASSASNSFLFRRGGLSSKLKYNFFIGPKLGNIWVGFDPGTSGSCIAASNASDGVIMEKDFNGKDKITPSLITFDQKVSPESYEDRNIVEQFKGKYNYGNAAEKEFLLASIRGFQSIKKLLGYTDEFMLEFDNGMKYPVNGKDLTTLLISGLFDEFKAYLQTNKTNHSGLLSEKGYFNPKRVVAAIPNNFTASKKQDLLRCIQNLDVFEDIRLITEAEAVICYYIFNHDRLHPGGEKLRDETVLIFDMGGATINAIVADAFDGNKKSDKAQYEIAIDSKIGYGIGGDTIDYCLAKILFSFEKEFPILAEFNPFNNSNLPLEEWQNLRDKIKSAIFGLKREIIRNYHMQFNESEQASIAPVFIKKPNQIGGPRALLQLVDLGNAIEQITGKKTEVPRTSNLYAQFLAPQNEEYPVFKNLIFEELLYLPIREAIRDAVALSEGEGGFIDTVIFSGRSSLFPLVKHNVRLALGTVRNKSPRRTEEIINPVIVELKEEELKTAVVKGAAWYGVHNKMVKLHPQKLNSTFGVKRKHSALARDVGFISLIKTGIDLPPEGLSNGSLSGKCAMVDDFNADGNMVNFFQVMGSDPESVIKYGQKHKYSRLAGIKLDQKTKEIGISWEMNDQTKCWVTMVGGDTKITNVASVEQEIMQENDEHYTWVVK